MRRLTTSVVAIVLTGCAARGPTLELIADASKAETLLRTGCYRCLEDALATYERVAASPRAPVNARQGAFDAALLLAVRSKELGLSPDQFMAKARALGAALPPAVAPALPPSAYLEAAEFFVGETSGFDPDVRQVRTRRNRSFAPDAPLPAPRAALEPAIATNIVADYLAIAIDCEDARRRKEVSRDSVIARRGDSPLFRFRLALCGLGGAIASLRVEDPRWVDTLLTEGRIVMGTRPVPDVQKAAQLYGAAHEAFPSSDAITLALANVQTSLAEYAAALANYDSVLSKEATHRDALLGRLINISYLNRHTEGIATATHLIDLGNWHIGDAYYWRAWNRYYTRDLEAAWVDIERATTLYVNSSVYALAGYIAYARRQLDTAIDRFDRAFAMDKTNCEAVWTGALVHVDQEGWAMAAPKFSTAMSCFVSTAAQARDLITKLESAELDPAFKARRVAVEEKRAETAEHRAAQAAFNAAQSFARLGQRASALSHIDMAIEHTQLREKATALKAAIEKMPQR